MIKITEHQIQSAFIDRCRWHEKKYPQLKLLWANANGGARSAVTGAMLKREGVRPGVPDIFLAWPSKGFHGLFIEFKAAKGRVSIHQQELMHGLEGAGYECEVCRSANEAWLAVMDYLGVKIPINET